jgi:hypothetical protein
MKELESRELFDPPKFSTQSSSSPGLLPLSTILFILLLRFIVVFTSFPCVSWFFLQMSDSKAQSSSTTHTKITSLLKDTVHIDMKAAQFWADNFSLADDADFKTFVDSLTKVVPESYQLIVNQIATIISCSLLSSLFSSLILLSSLSSSSLLSFLCFLFA